MTFSNIHKVTSSSLNCTKDGYVLMTQLADKCTVNILLAVGSAAAVTGTTMTLERPWTKCFIDYLIL